MLFDLQSRRRRTAVKVIYLLLAVLMAGGLILFGVGAGNGNGGFLNSLTGNGSGGNSAQNSAITKQLKKAEARTKANPNSPAAWVGLMQAGWSAAGQGKNYNSASETYTASGKQILRQTVVTGWQKYQSLVKGTPNVNTAELAAEAYAKIADYKGAAVAWQAVVAAAPTALKGYECLAYNAYAAKNNGLGDLASAKAIKLTPKLQRYQAKQSFKQVQGSATTAQQAVTQGC